jgi:hypothetical protein
MQANCMLPQYLLIILVSGIARICLCIRKDIESVVNSLKLESQISTLQQSRWKFRKLKRLVNHSNDFFSLIILITCLRDMIACIAVIALLLSSPIKDDGETNAVFLKRYTEDQLYSVPKYTLLAMSLFFAGCRITVFLYCNDQVRKLLKTPLFGKGNDLLNG